MNLPHVRTIAYLSPSALRMLEERPVEFYLRRLGPVEGSPPPEEQSFAAATGIAFDAFVKQALAKDHGLACPSQAFMLNDVHAANRDRATALGAQLLYGYRRCGAYAALEADTVAAVHYDTEDYAPGTTVPVRSKLDAITWPLGRRVPHDWKVAGANNPGTRSPTQGYVRCWDTDKPGDPGEPHKRSGEPMESWSPDWATQLCCYAWALGVKDQEMRASIDEVLVGANGRVRVAQFRATISDAFQAQLRARLEDAWARIREERVLPEGVRTMTPEQLRVMM